MEEKENKKDILKNETNNKKETTSTDLKNSQDELSKRKNNKSKIILIIAGCLVFLIVIIILSSLNNHSKYNNYNGNSNSDYANYTRNDISQYDIRFKCSLVNENNEEIVSNSYIGTDMYSYGLGDNLLCNLETSNGYKKEFNKVTFVLASNNIELEKVYSEDDSININTSYGSKNSTFVTLSTTQNALDLNKVKMKLHINGNIKDSEKYLIELSSISITTSPNTYDYLKLLTLELNHDSIRVVRDNGKLKFQAAKSDGTYKTTSVYTCKSSDNWCVVNNAAQTFYYQNQEEKNIVLIQDSQDNNIINIFYDTNNGIIATYGGSPRWLYSKNDKNDGTYIYIKNENNESYGIVDKKGKVIHDFNLNMVCLGNTDGSRCLSYSIDGNIFVNKKDNKYGIVKIDSNDVVIDYKYDDIKILNSKYFKASENGKWYIYDVATKDKHLEKSFDDIYVLLENTLIVSDGEYWTFIDYDNNPIINDKIKVNSEYKYVNYYTDTQNSNIIHIGFYNNDYGLDQAYESYDYNISNKVLTKK